ncbi:MAG: acyl-CoA dehydrogenase [Dermabacter sp.]|nr:acyl-CoA dehydrogenase [Dermabacter sp.]
MSTPTTTGSLRRLPTGSIPRVGAARSGTAESTAATTHAPGKRPRTLDTALVSRMLLGSFPDSRLTSRERAKNPELHDVVGLPLAEHRELVLDQLGILARARTNQAMLPESLGGTNCPGDNLAQFEELVVASPSLQIKAGVQWGLFAGAILQLGTEAHHEAWVEDAMTLALPGAFAMTETGHGSDVSSLATTATYDPDTDEFVIHTPFRAAYKDYLGNAACHARAATVFARLITRGVDHGVHCFFVPIRDAEGRFLDGIGGEDDGHKGGLLGVDNGRLHFTHMRVPRTNLLNRYGNVDADGVYTSPIASPGRRFFTMLGTLVQGRVSLDGAALRASQLGLGIAVTYASQRRQFQGASTTEETVLLDYQSHLNRLLPRIADVYAGQFAHDELLRSYDEVFSGRGDSDDAREDLETLAAALKPTSTRLALDVLQECREACGGQGFLAVNRLTELHADLDVYATFEGDNTVLLQLVAKRLLAEYSSELKNIDAAGVGRFIAGRADTLARRHTPFFRMVQAVSDAGSAKRAAESMRDPAFQEYMLATRARVMVEELALALRPAARMSSADASALVNKHQVEMIEAAKAHADFLRFTAFTNAVNEVSDPDTQHVLFRLRDLYSLTRIEAHLDWYLLGGHMSLQRGRTLRGYINRLLWKLRPNVVPLVEAFDLAPEHVRAPIALGEEKMRQDEAREYLREARAKRDAPVSEKSLAKKR